MRGNGVCYQERNRVERLARENGWCVDERDGDDRYLHFKSPLAGVRKVLVSRGDEALVVFCVLSFASIPGRDLPPEVAGYLLERNAKVVLGGWHMVISDDDRAGFAVKYVALGPGLNAGLFKHICESLNEEAHEFDVKMRKVGLL
jgi:hypothetical protein